MKVFAVSDLHADYKQNLEWCQDLSEIAFQDDAIILAGDICDGLETIETVLRCFTARFAHVFYCPGNHDLWVRRLEREEYDSIGKLQKLNDLCASLGVHTRPVRVEGVWIVPLLSWYHATWDREPDVEGARPVEQLMMDFHACRWPEPQLNALDDSLAQYFDKMNDEPLSSVRQSLDRSTGGNSGGAGTALERPVVITFSHFLPFQALLPDKQMLHHPNLAKAVGSDYLAARMKQLKPDVHIFGHTHFSYDVRLGGTRYVQWPLAYPAEQRHRRDGGVGWKPIAVYDSDGGGITASVSTYWSTYNKKTHSNLAST